VCSLSSKIVLGEVLIEQQEEEEAAARLS